MKTTIQYGLAGLVGGSAGGALNLWVQHRPMDIDFIFYSGISSSVGIVFVMLVMDHLAKKKPPTT